MEADGAGYGRGSARLDTNPRGWPLEKVVADHWYINKDTDRRPAAQPRLQEVLCTLRQGDFADRAVVVREGREIRFLESQQIIKTLIQLMAEASEHRVVIEQFLDELFRDFKKGQLFEHTELVIAILYALKRSGSALYPGIVDAFASSKIAEVGRIRHFAKQLLGQ